MKRVRVINEPFDPPRPLSKRAHKSRRIEVWHLEDPLFDVIDCRFVVCERKATWMVGDRDGNEIPVCTQHAMKMITGEMHDEECERKARKKMKRPRR